MQFWPLSVIYMPSTALESPMLPLKCMPHERNKLLVNVKKGKTTASKLDVLTINEKYYVNINLQLPKPKIMIVAQFHMIELGNGVSA